MKKEVKNIKESVVKKKRVILIIAIVLFVIGSGILLKVKFESDENRVLTNAQTSEESSSEESITEENKGQALSTEENNNSYVDEDSEDVMEVFHNTESVLKGEKKYPVRTDGKKVAYLTFDDGPSTTNTPKVLDILKANNINATFFVTGQQIDSGEQQEEILKRTVAEGNAIGNHTYSHDYSYLYPGRIINPDNFMADIEKTNNSLKRVLGENFETKAVRFPGGYWSWEGRVNIRPILDKEGYAIIDWNTLDEDAQGNTKNAEELLEVSRKNLDALGPDADSVIFLMHDTYGKEETVKALQGIIDLFKEKGFEFKTMK